MSTYTTTNPRTTTCYDLRKARSGDPTLTLPTEMLVSRCGDHEAAVALYETEASEVYESREALLRDHEIEQKRFPRAEYQWTAKDLDRLMEVLEDDACRILALATGR